MPVEPGKIEHGTSPSTEAVVSAGPGRLVRAGWPLVALVAAVGAFGWGISYSLKHRPKADAEPPLRAARALLDENKYTNALEALNERVLPMSSAGVLTQAQRQRFHTMRGEAISKGQQALGVDLKENNASVVAEYIAAEEAGAELEPAEVVRLGLAYAALGELEKAAGRARVLAEAHKEQAAIVFRAAVEGHVRAGGKPEAGLELIEEFMKKDVLGIDDRAWAVSERAQLQLAAGRTDEAIGMLLRELQMTQGGDRRGQFLVSLGEAYVTKGERGTALKQFEAAEEALGPSHPLRCVTAVEIGSLLHSTGRLEEAKERFSYVLSECGNTDRAPAAAWGLARIEAKQGNDVAAMEGFSGVVESLERKEKAAGVTGPAVGESLLAIHAERMNEGATLKALGYAELAERVYPAAEVPAEVLLAIATSHRKAADDALEAARGARRDLYWMDDVPPEVRAQAKGDFLAAGSYFRRHAAAVQAEKLDVYGESLWAAADCFDRGGVLDEAAKAFADFKDSVPENDPRRPESRFRLARVFQATGEYTTAAELYTALIEDGRRVDPTSGTGPWAERSVVPLAYCLWHDKDQTNDGRAEELLVSMLDGRRVGPDSEEYRSALIELGRMYYETGRHEAAVTKLSEADDRAPEGPWAVTVKYQLAESYRLSADQIARSLTQAMPQSQRQEFEVAREDRLKKASAMYERVKAILETREVSRLTDLEKVQLRNSWFFVGDCAYELKDYDAAIAAYDSARQRYMDSPAALVAMVQIVNAYVERGEWAKAKTANERARQHLARMPESAWASPDMPMERKHWEKWLESSARIEQQGATAGAESPAAEASH